MNTAYLLLLAIYAVLGLLPAKIAAAKGRSFSKWWLYGFLVFLPALIHAIAIRPRPRDEAPRPTIAWMPPPPYGAAPPAPRPDVIDAASVERGPAMAPCPSCGEIVRTDTPACPFCRATVAGVDAQPAG